MTDKPLTEKDVHLFKPIEDGWCEICGEGAVESGMHRCEKHKKQMEEDRWQRNKRRIM